MRSHLDKKLDPDLERIISFSNEGIEQQSLVNKDDLSIISFILGYAKNKHSAKKRKNGKPYIEHPISVAKILVDYSADYITICSGLLHDVVEEQVDANKEENPNLTDKELANIEGKLFISLQDDILKYFSYNMIKPLLQINEDSCYDLVLATHSKINELHNDYYNKLVQKMGTRIISKLVKPIELIKEDILKEERDFLLTEMKKNYVVNLRHDVKAFIKERYNLDLRDKDALTKLVTSTRDLSTMVRIVKLLTREKGIWYYKSIENIFTETDSEKKNRTMLVKMADLLDNTSDMSGEESIFSNSNKLYRCFKNIFVLNYVKNYLVHNKILQDNPTYMLFRKNCHQTHLVLLEVENSLKNKVENFKELDWRIEEYDKQKSGLNRITRANELNSPFDGCVINYLHSMQGHKDTLSKELANPEKQYVSAITLKKLASNLGLQDDYILTDLILNSNKIDNLYQNENKKSDS